MSFFEKFSIANNIKKLTEITKQCEPSPVFSSFQNIYNVPYYTLPKRKRGGRRRTRKYILNTPKTYKCRKKGCDFCGSKSELQSHAKNIHPKNIQIKRCRQDDCKFECKTKSELENHQRDVHYIVIEKWYSCPEEKCSYKTKTKESFQNHMSNVHDVGKHSCKICFKNVPKVQSWTDPNRGRMNVCCKCYKKVTGFNTKPEKEMVQSFRDDPFLSNYIVLEDSIVRGDSCATKRRPDLMLSSSDIHIIVECDENQHREYDPLCEMGRMDEIFDELKSGPVYFVRYNPDYYNPPKNQKKLNRKERLKYLIAYTKQILSQEWRKIYEHPIQVHYLFYNENNKVITNRHWKTLVY